MAEHDRGRLSRLEAADRVCAAMHRDDWIDSLTRRERWLLRRYVDGLARPQSSSILPGQTRYSVGGRSWAEIPGDPALVAEVDRARDRRDWRWAQYARAWAWLDSHGFDVDAEFIDRKALEDALAKDFPPKGAAKALLPIDAQAPRVLHESTRRAQRKKDKQAMYTTWRQLVDNHRTREDGTPRTRMEIAKLIAAYPAAADPTTKDAPEPTSVYRRLNEHHPGWYVGQKKVGQKKSA